MKNTCTLSYLPYCGVIQRNGVAKVTGLNKISDLKGGLKMRLDKEREIVSFQTLYPHGYEGETYVENLGDLRRNEKLYPYVEMFYKN